MNDTGTYPRDLPPAMPAFLRDEHAPIALCAQTDPELFFPEREADGAGRPTVEALTAAGICQQCPLLHDCAEWALDNQVAYGIWGGMTSGQRVRMLRRRRALAS